MKRTLNNAAYEERFKIYRQIQKLDEDKPFQAKGLVGAGGVQVDKFVQDKVAPIKAALQAYNGKLKTEVGSAGSSLLAAVEKKQREAFLAAYVQEANEELVKRKGFPLVRKTAKVLKLDDVKEADKLLAYISSDLKAGAFTAYAAKDHPQLVNLSEQVAKLSRVSKAILGDDAIPGNCTVSLLKSAGEHEDVDVWRDTFRDIKLDQNPSARTSDNQDSSLGVVSSIDQSFIVKLIKNINDGDRDASSYDAGSWGALRSLTSTPRKAKRRSKQTSRIGKLRCLLNLGMARAKSA